jgi:L-cystine uptake protein TcyP (sodium:dicarboxylate symporter family)
MKPVIIIVFFALFPGLTEAKLHHKKPTAEQMILTKINALYEVKEFMKYTPKAFKPVIIVYNEPTPQDKGGHQQF